MNQSLRRILQLNCFGQLFNSRHYYFGMNYRSKLLFFFILTGPVHNPGASLKVDGRGAVGALVQTD